MENLGNTFAESRLRNWNTCVLSTTQIKYRTTRSKESLEFENIIIEKVSSREKKQKKIFLFDNKFNTFEKNKKKRNLRGQTHFLFTKEISKLVNMYIIYQKVLQIYIWDFPVSSQCGFLSMVNSEGINLWASGTREKGSHELQTEAYLRGQCFWMKGKLKCIKIRTRIGSVIFRFCPTLRFGPPATEHPSYSYRNFDKNWTAIRRMPKSNKRGNE